MAELVAAAGISVHSGPRHTNWFHTLRSRVEIHLHDESLILKLPRAGSLTGAAVENNTDTLQFPNLQRAEFKSLL